MDEKLAIVLENLGDKGLEAFYVYLAVEYISMWALVGLVIYGIKKMVNKSE